MKGSFPLAGYFLKFFHIFFAPNLCDDTFEKFQILKFIQLDNINVDLLFVDFQIFSLSIYFREQKIHEIS